MSISPAQTPTPCLWAEDWPVWLRTTDSTGHWVEPCPAGVVQNYGKVLSTGALVRVSFTEFTGKGENKKIECEWSLQLKTHGSANLHRAYCSLQTFVS